MSLQFLNGYESSWASCPRYLSFCVPSISTSVSLESGNELVAKFTEERQNMKIAIGTLLTEGNEIATGKGASMKDVRGKD